MTYRHHLPSRREALLGAGALFAWSQMPRLARAEGRDPRMLVIVLRGALDGLGAVAPVGDPDWIGLARRPGAAARRQAAGAAARQLLRAQSGDAEPAPALQGAAGRPSCTPPRRPIASARISMARTFWRAASRGRAPSTPAGSTARCSELASDGRVDPRGSRVLGVGSVTPLVVRGQAPVMSWVPQQLLPASEDTQARLLDLYQHTDPKLAAALEARMRLAALGRTGAVGRLRWPTTRRLRRPASRACAPISPRPPARPRAISPGRTAPASARLGFVGWDTHINEGAASGQLANLLGALDGALAAIETNMGDAWRETVVAVITEFGRTARINGTDGTDHGTGTVAFLAGGALRGGRVIADWPGLKPAELYEGRDLKPTTDLRAVLKGLLRDHLRVEERALASTVFPDSADVAPIAGLVG